MTEDRVPYGNQKRGASRIHLYYPTEDQMELAEAVELSPFRSASALVRHLVRQYRRGQLNKIKRSCNS